MEEAEGEAEEGHGGSRAGQRGCNHGVFYSERSGKPLEELEHKSDIIWLNLKKQR